MLNLDPWTVLWTGINLVVLYLLMRHFLFKPVTAMMEQRTKAIEDGLSQAEAAKQAAQALDQENEARLAQAEDDARRVQAEAESRLATERENMLRGARNEVASLALLAAAKAAESIARQPEAAGQIRSSMLIGCALAEATAI